MRARYILIATIIPILLVPDDTYKKNPNLGQNAGWELSDAPKKDDTTEGGETTEGETTGK